MPVNTMTAGASKLNVTNSGTYRVFYSVNASSKQSGEVKPYIRVNNAAVEHSAVNGSFAADTAASLSGDKPETSYKDFQNSFMADLNAGDKIDLCIEFPNASKYPYFTLNIAAKRAILHAVRIK